MFGSFGMVLHLLAISSQGATTVYLEGLGDLVSRFIGGSYMTDGQ